MATVPKVTREVHEAASFLRQPGVPECVAMDSPPGSEGCCGHMLALPLTSWRNSSISLYLRLLTCQLRTTHTSWISCENHRTQCWKVLSSLLGTATPGSSKN